MKNTPAVYLEISYLCSRAVAGPGLSDDPSEAAPHMPRQCQGLPTAAPGATRVDLGTTFTIEISPPALTTTDLLTQHSYHQIGRNNFSSFSIPLYTHST